MEFSEIEKYLGKPYFKNKNTILYNMNSLDAMQNLPNEIFDLVLTSPPYNIGKEYEKIKPIKEYLKWSEIWMDHVYNLVKNNGSFWLNIGYTPIKNKGKAVPLSYLLWDKNKFFLIQELVWHYGAGVAARKSLSPRNEKVLWFVKNENNYTFNLDDIRDPNVKYPNQKKNGKVRVNPLGKNPSDVWNIPKVTSGSKRHSKERVNHPAQTPIELFKRIILASTNKGDWVLDPFVGSGTACVVSNSLGRKSIGFDTNKDYLDIAISRILSEKFIQTSLFKKEQ